MARRIISATDYSFRKVIRVVMNDGIPEWVHPIDNGAPHTPSTARGPFLLDGTPGPVVPGLAAGTECHACVFNHDVRELIFTQEEFMVEDPIGSGVIRVKTDDELVTEIQLRLQTPPTPRPMSNLQRMVF